MSGSSNAIGQLFSLGAQGYDAVRRNLVPCFDAFYTSALDVIGDWAHGRMPAALEVLDLGAGTGLFSAMVMARLPRVRLHLIDASDAMLAEARRRFAGVAAPNVSFEVRDYSEGNLGGPWDLVISALSIHHVEDGAKRSLFKRVFEALRPGGLFVNAEQVLGPTPAAEARYRRLWDEQAELGRGPTRIRARGGTDAPRPMRAAWRSARMDARSGLRRDRLRLQTVAFRGLLRRASVAFGGSHGHASSAPMLFLNLPPTP